MAGFFQTLQEEIAARLADDPFFQDIPVLWELERDIVKRVEAAISKIGAGVLVITPTATVEDPNLPGPFYGDIGIVIQVYSDPVKAKDKPRAMEIAQVVMSLLHHWQAESTSGPLIADKPTIVPAQTDDPNTDGRDVRFTCKGGKSFDVPKVTAPVLTLADGVLSITCETEGAMIFFREDGKRPVPRTGTRYTGSFTPEAGIKVAAAAWFPGMLTSDVVKLSVP